MPYGRNIVFLPPRKTTTHCMSGSPVNPTRKSPRRAKCTVADRPAYVHPRRSMSHLPAHGMLRRTSQHVAPQ